MRWGTVLAGAFVFVVAARPGSAHADDTWSDPLPGVRLLQRTTGTPWRIVAMQIDLCHDGVSMRATMSGERQRTVSSFAGAVGAHAAVNGDFFSYADYSTNGLSMGAGEQWGDTADNDYSGFVAFGRGRAEVSTPAALVDPPASWMANVVSGTRPLVEDGVAYPGDDADLCTTRHPRTAAGLSADGRMLVLAVVDGRSNSSVGMSCPELAGLMVELGAHDASMFDGGGSTTMWMTGSGVLNSPSDGGQRVVANHLGVIAAGSGEPGSCDRSFEEAGLHADAIGANTSSDLDGDGLADLCARSGAGIRCRLAADDFATDVIGPEWSDELGWNDVSNYATLRMGDLDGDGKADLCGRANDRVLCHTSATGVLADVVDGPLLDDASGFADASRWSTLRMADVDGDGKDDLCALTDAGFSCWPSTGTGFAAEPWTIAGLATELARASQYGTIRTADLDADGRTDVCARRSDGLACWRATETGFGPAIAGPAWSDDAGWDRVEYWSTIRLFDLDGDRRADLCARAAAGMICHLSTDDGFGEAIVGPEWSDESGWWDYSNYSTIRVGDIDGDGDGDLCARANAGVICSTYEDGVFAPAFAGPTLADENGWGSIRFFGTLRLADIDGDGRADLCARSAADVSCWISQGTAFAPDPVVGPGWSDESGWGAPQYYETLRMSTAVPRCFVEERCDDGVDDDCDGEIDEDCDAGEGGTRGDDASDGGGEDSGLSGSSGGRDVLPTSFGETDDDAGCGCNTRGRGHGLLVGVVLLMGRRRRGLALPMRC